MSGSKRFEGAYDVLRRCDELKRATSPIKSSASDREDALGSLASCFSDASAAGDRSRTVVDSRASVNESSYLARELAILKAQQARTFAELCRAREANARTSVEDSGGRQVTARAASPKPHVISFEDLEAPSPKPLSRPQLQESPKPASPPTKRAQDRKPAVPKQSLTVATRSTRGEAAGTDTTRHSDPGYKVSEFDYTRSRLRAAEELRHKREQLQDKRPTSPSHSSPQRRVAAARTTSRAATPSKRPVVANRSNDLRNLSDSASKRLGPGQGASAWNPPSNRHVSNSKHTASPSVADTSVEGMVSLAGIPTQDGEEANIGAFRMLCQNTDPTVMCQHIDFESALADGFDTQTMLLLTHVVNHPTMCAQVVVPLLAGKLTLAEGAGALSNALRAIAGLGDICVSLLDPLLNLLVAGIGEPKLVALAIRCAAGEAAVVALCRLLGAHSQSRVRSACAYALSLLVTPVHGRTFVFVSPGHGHGATHDAHISFLPQPMSDDTHAPAEELDGSYVHLRPAPYVDTHITVDYLWLLRALRSLALTPQFRPTLRSHVPVAGVRAYFNLFTLHGAGHTLFRNVPDLAALRNEIVPFLPQPTTFELAGGYDAFEGNRELTKTVSSALLGQLSNATDDGVKEQCVVALFTVPLRGEHLVPPLLRLSATLRTLPPALAAALLFAVGKRVAGGEPCAESVLQLLAGALTHASGRVRAAACAALGVIGPQAAACLDAVLQSVRNRCLPAKLGMQCVASMGPPGIDSLLQIIQLEPDDAARIAAATALGRIDPSMYSLDTIGRVLSSVASNEVRNPLVLAAVEALGALSTFAANHSEDSELFLHFLAPFLTHAHAPVRELAGKLLVRSGPHGELVAIHQLLSEDSPCLRRTAGGALRHCTEPPIRALSMAVCDADATVRATVLDVLQSFPLPALKAAVSSLPRAKREQAAKSLRGYSAVYGDVPVLYELLDACDAL